MFCATLGVTIIPQSIITLETSSVANSNTSEVKPFQANPEHLNTSLAIISVANWLVVPLVFMMWIATAFTLKGYRKKFRIIRYWSMILVPLVGFVIGLTFLLILLPSLTSIFDQKAIFYASIAFGGILAEGFLLGFAFFVISRNISANNKAKEYLLIASYGVIILFVSFFANPSAGSYMPFGVLASSFFGLGAYLFFSGIYSTAISISSDSGLRQTIRQLLLDKSKLIDNIAAADINKDLEKKIQELAKDYIKDETGIEPSLSSLSDFAVKQYIEDTMKEIQAAKKAK